MRLAEGGSFKNTSSVGTLEYLFVVLDPGGLLFIAEALWRQDNARLWCYGGWTSFLRCDSHGEGICGLQIRIADVQEPDPILGISIVYTGPSSEAPLMIQSESRESLSEVPGFPTPNAVHLGHCFCYKELKRNLNRRRPITHVYALLDEEFLINNANIPIKFTWYTTKFPLITSSVLCFIGLACIIKNILFLNMKHQCHYSQRSFISMQRS